MDVNAWWSAIGRHAARGVPVSTAWDRLGHAQQVILGGVTLWGGRLAYRIINRSLRRGIDDPRYEAAKKDPGFWNTAPFSVFLPEAIFQALISIPFTLPFRLGQLDAHTLTGAPGDLGSIARYTAAGLFTAGLALETLADWQIDSHKAKYRQNTADEDLYRNGVWSIVRHPNYLGDALVHFSFALWCWGIHQFHPLMALGPVMNYFFLRHVGGDKYTIPTLVVFVDYHADE